MKKLGFLVLVVGLLGPAGVLGQAADRVADGRAIYEKTLKGIRDSAAEALAAWPRHYEAELARLQKSYQAEGDLDAWQAVDAEIKRVHARPGIPEDALSIKTPQLRILQLKYRNIAARCAKDKAEKIVALYEKYAEFLDDLKVEMTRAGKIDEALIANRELERVRKSVDVTSAQFELALLKRSVDPSPTAGEEDLASDDPEAAGAMDDEREVPEGYVIHEPGRRPPLPDGVHLKRLATSRTGNVPMGGTLVSVNAEWGKQQAVASSSSYYGSSSKSLNEAYRLRLAFRPRSAGETLHNLTTVVEYFGRRKETSGKIQPQLLACHRIVLPTVSAHTLYVDFPPVSVQHRSYSSSYYSSSYGTEMYGMIITVFDEDGQRIYQGASARGLNEFAERTKHVDPVQAAEAEYEKAREAYDEARRAYYEDTGNEALRRDYEEKRAAYYEARSKRDSVRRSSY